MQRSMVELLMDVKSRASDLGCDSRGSREKGLVGDSCLSGTGGERMRPQTTSWAPGDAARHAAQARILGLSLATPRGEAAKGDRASTADARFRPWCWARERRPLGEALRRDREILKSQERSQEQRSILGVLSTCDFSTSFGASGSQALALPAPRKPRCGGPPAPPSTVTRPDSEYTPGSSTKGNGKCVVRVVHRHNHHHYHHHYFPDANDDSALDAPLGKDDLPPGGPTMLAEEALLPSSNVLLHGDLPRTRGATAPENALTSGQLNTETCSTSVAGAKRHDEEHRHLHHHHHSGEQGIPPRARRLLDDARFAAAAEEVAKNGAAAADADCASRRGGPDPRLPRLG